MTKMMHVVSGLAVAHNGTILMGKRKPSGLRPGLWELPGGKVEEGEHFSIALAREWCEELSVVVLVKPRRIASSIFRLEQMIQVDLYEVTFDSVYDIPNSLRNLDHEELRWVSPLEAVRSLPCSPGYYTHYDELRHYLLETGRWFE